MTLTPKRQLLARLAVVAVARACEMVTLLDDLYKEYTIDPWQQQY